MEGMRKDWMSLLVLCLSNDSVESGQYGCYCSIVVSTSDCGSENPGSNPGSGNFLSFQKNAGCIFSITIKFGFCVFCIYHK